MGPPRVTYSQVLCALADGANGLSLACILGYTSSALLSMSNDPNFDITEEQGSWIGAIVPGVALIGSLLAGRFLERFGRKKTVTMTTIPSIFAWLLLAYARTPLEVIFARGVSGICLGIQQVSVSVFISESIHPELQNVFGIIPGVATMAGFVAINVSGSITDWRGMAWVGFGSSIVLFLCFLILSETPYFLLVSDKRKQSLEALKWLRQEDTDAQKEFNELSQAVSSASKKEKVTFSDMMKPPYRWPFSAAVLLHVFQQLTGVGAITSFMGIIFERSGSAVDPNVATITMTAINMVSIFLVGKYMGKYPRKLFIRASSVFIITPLIVFAWYMYAREIGIELPYIFAYIPFISISTYMLGFSFGWAPLPWMFLKDSLPFKIRDSATGIVIAINWGLNFITAKTFSSTVSKFGYHNVYNAYALCTLLGCFVMNNLIPETFGFNEIKLEKYYRDGYKKKTK